MAQQLLTNFTPPGSTSSYKFRAGGLFYGTTSGTSSAMTVTIPGVSEYYTGCAEHIFLAKEAAKEGIVLLKNEDNLLPLK